MALNVNNRPLVASKPVVKAAAKPVVVAKAAAPVAPAAPVKAQAIPLPPLSTWTPPVIVDIIWQGFKGGFGLANLAWMVGPSIFRNARDVVSHKESVGRGAANVVTESSINIGKGIAAGVAVQALQIAAGPLLGLIPAAALPFAGIALGLGGLVGSYWLLGKVVKATGLDTAMSNGLTKLFGGDLKPQTPAKA